MISRIGLATCFRQCLGLALPLLLAVPALAYVEIPYTLGRLVNESTHIVLMRVEKVDREKNLIIFRKVQDIKGTHPQEVIKHNIGRGGFHPREWQTIMKWAEPGKTAVFMHNGGASETCIEGYWYQAYSGGEWWNMSHSEPYLLRSFAGKPDKLAPAVTQMLAGQEVIVPCMVDGDKNAIQLGTARIQRLRASLKLTEYDAQRDFVGWGGNEDFRKIAGMPGFSHVGTVSRVDPGASGVAAADFDGDGKIDFCLYGESRVVLLQNDGKALNEVSLPISGGARSAAWADYNGNGRPDLLLATPTGPRLLENQGEGQFKDISASLPREAYYNCTAAAWIDADADGRPDILLSNGFLGLRLYRNLGPEAQAARPKGPALGKWHYCGPFENAGDVGFAKAYPPEQGVDLKAKHPGKRGAVAEWKEGNFADGQINNLALFGDKNDDCTVYVYREMDFGSAVELPISLGSDDTIVVWLNGEKQLAVQEHRAAAPDQHLLTLRLRPGRNELLMKIGNGNGEFAFYFASKAEVEPIPPLFEDASSRFGLGPNGLAGDMKGDHLLVADFNGDGRQDFLYTAGSGVLVLNTPEGFQLATDAAGVERQTGVAPAVGDFDGDGRPGLFVPQAGASKLYRNLGGGKFADVTAASGLAALNAQATSAVWTCFDQTGDAPQLDLVVGCLRGPNRVFRNQGGGKFVDATVELGLQTRIYNTRGVHAADVNGDGVVDLVFNNEGQDPTVLLGAAPSEVASSE